jgi:pantetheine-phosphate adenylyltransferase
LTVAIYPGTFDPVTNGHLDIAVRTARIFERLIIGVYDIPNKHLLFNTEERVDLIRRAITDLHNVRVEAFNGLTVDFARKVGAQVMVRGLRMSADFEREFDMAMMNKKLAPELELVCLMSRLEYQFISSSLLKEAASLGGCINELVPGHVAEALREKAHSKL